MRDQYNFLNVLGVGSFGTTWKAQDKITGKFVAIKIFLDNAMIDWEHEKQMIASLSKECTPYAVCVIDSFVEDSTPYLVMEFVNGKTVGQILRKNQKRPDGLKLLKDLVEGIKIFHSHSLVHEDVKDDNIMYDDDMQLFRYIDFGLSCVKKSNTLDLAARNFPCGTYGTSYIASPVFERKRMQKAIVPWSLLESHDYWCIGLVVLRWYYHPKNYVPSYTRWVGKKPTAEFIEDTKLNTSYPIYRLLDHRYVKSIIKRIRNQKVRRCLFLLLNYDDYKRAEDFNKVLKILG